MDLERFKKRVRVDFDDMDDDLQATLDAAEEWVIRETHRSYEELCSMNGGEFPKSLEQAIIMLAAHWVNQVEAVGSNSLAEVPYSIQAILKTWRKLSDNESGSDEEPADDTEAGDEEE